MTRRSLFLLIILIGFMSGKAWAYTSKDCIRCHHEQSEESVLHITVDEFQGSIHGSELTCQDCHAAIMSEDHEKIKGSGAVDCGQCHEQENRHGRLSTNENQPLCHSCHTRHGILPKSDQRSTVHPNHLKQTCSGCHPIESGETGLIALLPSIRIMSHKKQDFSRVYEKDNCIGCHQGQAVHGEVEPIDDQDCHQCHMPLKDRGMVMGYIHTRDDVRKQPVIFSAAILYLIAIVILLWSGFRYIAHSLFRKPKKGRN